MNEQRSVEVAIVSGLAGAGKTVALDALEDLGFYAIDNLPSALLDAFVDSVVTGRFASPRIAVALDARDPGVPAAFERVESRLSQVARVSVIFVEAQEEVLVNRFRETRRIHPLSLVSAVHSEPVPLAEAIRRDAAILASLRIRANRIIDTTEMTAHYLRYLIRGAYGDPNLNQDLLINVVSFGFKHGVPRDLDTIFDVRCFPNPHYVDSLRPLTGRSREVQEFVFADPNVGRFIDQVSALLTFLYPLYRSEGKSYLGVGIGCTGGKHRSVAIVESLAERLRVVAPRVSVEHRHFDRE